jgi:hypothetical protein
MKSIDEGSGGQHIDMFLGPTTFPYQHFGDISYHTQTMKRRPYTLFPGHSELPPHSTYNFMSIPIFLPSS